ncbi:hypothetical protein TRIUR3_03880 [Triticum urartu]|uniref:Uncharacterized protein n=1 Tax=Triticum urartu TaxID=4572 RepID=M7Y5Z8_TRIUA|nr:hypothetical protein TRIUR3_03880 [Triticum urartu]
MAVAAGGGVVLSLRVPSSSAWPAVGRRRRASPSAAGRGQEGLPPPRTAVPPGRRAPRKQRHRGLRADQRGIPEGDEQHAGGGGRLEYWRRRYSLADEDLDRYRQYLNEEDEDDWFADL